MSKYLLIIYVILSIPLYAQSDEDIIDSAQINQPLPIIFGDLNFGWASMKQGKNALQYGLSINHQFNRNLFTLRYNELNSYRANAEMVIPFIVIPDFKRKSNYKEIGFLYGKRWIYNRSSLSISAGFSYNFITDYSDGESNQIVRTKENGLGFPIELSYKIFKAEKSRYGLYYGLIPIGKPTAFGRNFGVKLIGNISNRSFVGIGLVAGLGVHKIY